MIYWKKNWVFRTVGTIRYPHARIRVRERQIQRQKERHTESLPHTQQSTCIGLDIMSEIKL